METLKSSPLSRRHHAQKPAGTASRCNNVLSKFLLFILCCYTLGTAKAQLHGNYTINASAAASATNYQDFRSVVTDLDSGIRYDGGPATGPGVNGATVFKVADGTYKEQVRLHTVTGSSNANTILFESASGDSSKVVLKMNASDIGSVNNVTTDYVFWLDTVSYVNIKGMTLWRPLVLNSDGFALVINMAGGHDNSISNCRIIGDKNSYFSNNITIASYPGDSAYNIKVLHNFVKWGRHCLSANTVKNLAVEGNIFDSALNDVINLSKTDHFNFIGNVISSGNQNNINFNNGTIDHISKNRFNCNNGIYFEEVHNDSLNPAIISNNIFTTGSEPVENSSAGFVYFVNNTIYCKGGITALIRSYKSPTGHGHVYFENNLLSNYSSGTYGVDLYANGNDTYDNNDYYLSGYTYFGYNNTTYFTDFAHWQSILEIDAHSQQVNPYFVDHVNLVPRNNKLNKGVPLNIVTDDINGNPRSTTNPTIGAVEIGHLEDTTICKGSCADIRAPITGSSYRWSDGSTTQTIKYCASHSDSLWVTIKFGPGAGDTVHYAFKVYVTANSCVWPGDANYDGTAGIYDLLNVGTAYGDTGFVRPTASTTWTGQSCPDWANSFVGGVNHKHADCNGDGTVDSADISVIPLNTSKTHLKGTAAASGNPTDPPLSVSFSKDSAMAGDTVQAYIKLGSSTIPATSVYGIAMKINSEGKGTPNYYKADFSNCWLGTIKKDMASLIINDSNNNQIDVGLTRTDHKDKTGYGEIGVLSIVMPDNLAGKREVKQVLQFIVAAYKCISASEKNVPLNPLGDSILVFQYKSGINLSKQPDLKIYPNPAHDFLYLSTGNEQIKSAEIVNILGETVYTAKPTNTNMLAIPTSMLKKGLYFINAKTENNAGRTRFLKE